MRTRIFLVIAGVTVMGLGIGVMRQAAFGNDPYTAMNLGISQTVGLSLGLGQLAINGIILAGVFFIDRKKIGFATVFNMVATGFIADFFWTVCKRLLPLLPFYGRIILLLVAVVVLCFGVAMYIEGNLGVSPYDAVAIIISEKTRRPRWFRWIRIATDLLCVLTGFLCGSIVGAGTVITAFFTGPLVAFFQEHLRWKS